MIDILLATYNGEKYIEAQIFSLLSQTYKDWQLLVHDDGSTDGTLEIIKKFQENDSRIILLEDGVKFGNAGTNFLHLLKYNSDSEFTIFCDQDDIWFEDKLLVLYNLIKDKEVPSAGYCNAYTYDGTKITGDTVTYFHRKSLEDSLFLNGGVQGCSLIFNKKLRDILSEYPQYVYMHDHLVTMAAITLGELHYIDIPLMLYRQHDSNVTGNMQVSLIDRVITFLDRNNSIIEKRHFHANKSFYEKNEHLLSSKQKHLFHEYFRFIEVNLLNRILIVLLNSFKIGNSVSILLLKTLIRKPIC